MSFSFGHNEEQGLRRLTSIPTTPSRTRWAIPALASILYFSEGFPFGMANEGVNLYLSALHIPLGTIGLAGSVGLVWTLKFLWAPLVDTVASYRAWILGALVVIAASLVALGNVPAATTAFWAALLVLVFASATQDIAADALMVRATPEPLMGIVNSARVTAYRAAMLVAGGSGALATILGWRGAFTIAAAVPLLIFVLMLFATPAESNAREHHVNPFRGLLTWVQRPGAIALLAVILLYRLGDNALTNMIRPYWIKRGYGAGEIGTVTITLGMICTIAGAIAGGAFVTRFGIYRSLVALGIVQMLSNLAYAYVAMTDAGRVALYTAAMIEPFCGGLGTAAFLAFLMRICDKENAATEYAMLSGVFALGRTFAFALSGYVAQRMGFAPYYALTAALALPGLALLPLIRARVATTAKPAQ
jgi:PAT family beta-lactamase induction signal transducer AmpG